jgi:tungstate transport system substrate-binding protein
MKIDMKLVAVAVVTVLVVSAVGAYLLLREDKDSLLLATTTSTEDSGLLDYILPYFEDEFNCDVDVIAVGSGTAIEYGKRGDVDVLLTHSPAAENAFIAGGYGEFKKKVMYNNFVIVGPDGDPAGTSTSQNASQAFVRIYENGTAGDVMFASRADDSGTHTKELSLWAKAGLNASTFSNDWYEETGLGMGDLLDFCEEKVDDHEYTLSDDATYYQRVEQGTIPDLTITYSGDPLLFNQYSVMPVNSTMHPHVNHTLAVGFADWLVTEVTQDLIASYEKYGHQLFFPNADVSMLSASFATGCVETSNLGQGLTLAIPLEEIAIRGFARDLVWCCG